MSLFKKIIPYLAVLVLILPLIWPLLQSGFFRSDDGEWMVIRLSAFHETLKTGQFPVRFLERLNHGYGYPVMDFLYPLPFYAGELIHLLGFSFIDSVKLLFALTFVLSALTMYLFVEKEWGKWPGIIAAVFYVWAPYRIFDVYSRGSLGESFAFIFPPLIFYFLNRMFADQKLKWLSLAAVSYGCLICSHNVIAFLFTPVILAYLIVLGPQSRHGGTRTASFAYSSFFILLALLASSWFWFPALYDLQFTRASSVVVSNFSQYFISPTTLISLVGITTLLIIAAAVFLMPKKNNRHPNIPLFVLTAIISLFFALPFSNFLWQALPIPRLVQFPWRFLSVTVFSCAVLAGFVISKMGKKWWLVPIALLFTILPAIPQFKIDRIFYGDNSYITNDDTTTVKNEYMPKWVIKDPLSRPAQKYEIIGPDRIQINTVYFPGWEVFINGKQTAINYENGLMEISAKSTDHIIAQFTETPPRLAADVFSLIGIAATIIFLFL